MTYQETCSYLFRQTNFETQGHDGYKDGLDGTLAIDSHFAHPHRSYKTIHVAGTNGKGSVAHTIAALLQVHGYRVGLYTSPHLLDFRERIRVNGIPIDESYVTDFVERGMSFWQTLRPSFFEITTAMAFQYFKEQKVDIAVIEVGLGGRIDCTNIINPVLSIITNISKDHTQLLGNTLAAIAREKAGIIKSDTPVVVGEVTAETRPVFSEVAESHLAPIVFAEDNCLIADAEPAKDGGWLYTTTVGTHLHGELGGICQPKNANTILNAIHQLSLLGIVPDYCSPTTTTAELSELQRALSEVCELTGLMGRWQVMGKQPFVVCDTGHNPGGWQYISRQLEQLACQRLHIIFGMVADKDVDSVLAMLPQHAIYYFTQPNSHRAMPCRDLQAAALKHGLQGDCYDNVADAVSQAKASASPLDAIFIGGSTYIVADFMACNK